MSKKRYKIPKFLKYIIWPYKLEAIDIEKGKDDIITQVLNREGWKEVKWLFKTYTKEDIINVLKKLSRGVWFKDVLDFWLKIFDLKIDRRRYEIAIFDLKPKPPKLLKDYFDGKF